MKSKLSLLIFALLFVFGLMSAANAYLDPDTGEFITKDPAGFVDGPNQYTYVKQNPWTYFDPQGLQTAGQSETYWMTHGGDIDMQAATKTPDMVTITTQYAGLAAQATMIVAPVPKSGLIESTETKMAGSIVESKAPSVLERAWSWITGLGVKAAPLADATATVLESSLKQESADTVALADGIALKVSEAPTINFYADVNGTIWPATGYRAIGGKAVDAAEAGDLMSASGPTYITFDNITNMTGAEVKDILQLKYEPTHAATFDTLQLQDLTIPNGRWGTAPDLEPITNSFPEFGSGGATQATTEINIGNFTLKPLKAATDAAEH